MKGTFVLVAVGALAAIGAPSVRAQDSGALADGERVYVNASCAYCHGNDGEGGWNGEHLEGNERLRNDALVVNMILFGGAIMEGFADDLSDAEIAAVANYIRNSWGNSTPPIPVDYVARTRGR